MASILDRIRDIFRKKPGTTDGERNRSENVQEGNAAAVFYPTREYSPGATYGEAAKQCEEYRLWVYTAVSFRAELLSSPPQVARVVSGESRSKAASYRLKAWQAARRGRPYVETPRRMPRGLYLKAAKPANARQEDDLEYLDKDHPAVRLLNNPNDPQVGRDLWYTASMFLDLCGRSHIWIVRDGNGLPKELWNLPPHWVQPQPGNGRLIDYFDVTCPMAEGVARLPAEDVITIGRPGVWGPLSYTSPLQAHGLNVDLFNAMSLARYTSLMNGASVGMVVSIEGWSGKDDAARQRIEQRFRAMNAGVGNFMRPLFTDEGVNVTNMTGENELAFRESMNQSRKDTLAVYGLDESIMGYANASSWASAMVTDAAINKRIVHPYHTYVASVLTEKLLVSYGDDLVAIWPDVSDESPEDKKSRISLMKECQAITPNEVRDEFGFEALDDPFYDLPTGTLPPLDEGDEDVGNDEPSPPGSAEPEERTKGFTGRKRDSMGRLYEWRDGVRVGIAKPHGAVHRLHAVKAKAKKRTPKPEREVKRKTSMSGREKRAKAKAAHVLIDRDAQRYAEDHNEMSLARAVGGQANGNGSASDVDFEMDGIPHHVELKTIVGGATYGRGFKITMDSYSQVRKIEHEQSTGGVFHTVVFDDRKVMNAGGKGAHDEARRVIYYRRGVAGSARSETLHKCSSLKELKSLMAAEEYELPPGAQRTDDKHRLGRWKFGEDKHGKFYRNSKTGVVHRAKK